MQIKTTRRLSPHIDQNGHHEKIDKKIKAGGGVEKRESSYTVSGSAT